MTDPTTNSPGRSVGVELLGDAALLVTLGDRVDPVLADRAQAIARLLDGLRGRDLGFGRAVPAHASVLLPFDPLAIAPQEAVAVVRNELAGAPEAGTWTAIGGVEPAADAAGAATAAAAIEIPVRYGGADGPDLAAVAEKLGLPPARVVDLHVGATYRVLFLGFAPGFAYLDGLPGELAVPRRASPRERVPAGSVGIAGPQTAIYPLSMPGGWQLIGRTDVRVFDATRPEPALLRPGSTIRFVPLR